MMWFFPSLWFLSALWFFAELVDLRSKVVINGKPQRYLTTESILCYARFSEVAMNTIKCSCFRNIQSKKASEIITLADFVERIKTHDDKVIEARAYLATGNRKGYDAAKRELPA